MRRKSAGIVWFDAKRSQPEDRKITQSTFRFMKRDEIEE
jgi:hypothetical protein